MTIPSEQASRPAGDLAGLCGEVAGIFRRAWGRGPVKSTAHWAGPDLLVVMLENGHTDAERTLRAAGHIQQLVGGRELLQVIVEDELREAVEEAVGRPVVASLSATRIDPDLSAEIFVLGSGGADPEAAGDAAQLAERARQAEARAQELNDEASALEAQAQQLRRMLRKRSRESE